MNRILSIALLCSCAFPSGLAKASSVSSAGNEPVVDTGQIAVSRTTTNNIAVLYIGSRFLSFGLMPGSIVQSLNGVPISKVCLLELGSLLRRAALPDVDAKFSSSGDLSLELRATSNTGLQIPQRISGDSVIVRVLSNSAAYNAGLRTGDEIVKLQGKRVRTVSNASIDTIFQHSNILTIQYLRQNKLHKMRLKKSIAPSLTIYPSICTNKAPTPPIGSLNGSGLEGQGFHGWTLLNFWGSWCLPCREELPTLVRYAQQFGMNGQLHIESIAIQDTSTAVASFLAGQSPGFPVIISSNSAVLEKLFYLDTYPSNILVAPNGKIVYVTSALLPSSRSEKRFSAFLERELGPSNQSSANVGSIPISGRRLCH